MNNARVSVDSIIKAGENMTSNIRYQHILGIIFAAVVFLTALSVRGYRLAEIQPHHDEAPLFGLNRGEELKWSGSLNQYLVGLSRKAVYLTECDTPPLPCALAELFRGAFGENLVAARWLHAIIQSFGVALLSWLAWRIYRPSWFPAISVALLATFSIASIYFGQFGEMYAIYFLAAVIQCLAYWLIFRARYTWSRYGFFIIIAVICSRLEYLQAWVTLGLLLASVIERSRVPRKQRIVRVLAAIVLYLVLNIMPFIFLLGATREGESLVSGYLHYYQHYYPPGEANSGDG